MPTPPLDFAAILTQLHVNLDMLQERAAKFGLNVPLDLLHQLDDHRAAITLTGQARAGQLTETEWRAALKPLLVSLNPAGGEAAISLVIGAVTGGISEIGEIKLNLVPLAAALGRPLPHDNLPALADALRQALPHLDPPQQAAVRAALDQLEQQLAALPQHEQAYLQRVRDRYHRPATIFVELAADAYEQPVAAPPPDEFDLAAVAELMRRSETMPNLDEWQVRGQEIKRVRLNSLAEAAGRYPCLILLGDPGSGKTTADNHLAYQLAAAPPPPQGGLRGVFTENPVKVKSQF